MKALPHTYVFLPMFYYVDEEIKSILSEWVIKRVTELSPDSYGDIYLFCSVFFHFSTFIEIENQSLDDSSHLIAFGKCLDPAY